MPSAAVMNMTFEWASFEVPRVKWAVSYASKDAPDAKVMSLASLRKMGRCRLTRKFSKRWMHSN